MSLLFFLRSQSPWAPGGLSLAPKADILKPLKDKKKEEEEKLRKRQKQEEEFLLLMDLFDA